MNVKALSKFLLAFSVLLAAASCEKEAIQIEDNPADAAVEFRTDHCDAVIDFEENLDPGHTIASLSVGNGISGSGIPGFVTVEGKARQSDRVTLWPGNRAMVYDADQAPPPPPPTGGDDDLLGGEGNVAILSEDGDATDPDDNTFGGTFHFDFSNFAGGSVGILEFTAIDTEEPVGGPAGAASGTWTAYDAASNPIASGDIPSVTNGDVQMVPVGIGSGVVKFDVFLRGSGAIDNICLSVEDEDPGCTRTQGYWKTHSEYGPASYDNTWAQLPNGADTPFFLSGKSWYQVFHTLPAGGNAYYSLAHQYMAAVLNELAGADVSAVSGELAAAKTLFETYTPAQIGALKGNSTLRKQFLSLAETLDKYNNGLIGPGKCD